MFLGFTITLTNSGNRIIMLNHYLSITVLLRNIFKLIETEFPISICLLHAYF